jgi:hypothetical protein
MFGLERDMLTGEWRRLHIEELYNLYSTPHIIRLIKSRRMILPEHVAGTGDGGGSYLKERGHLEDLGIDGRIILK